MKLVDFQLADLIYIKHGFAFKGEFISDQPTDNVLVTPGNFSIGGGFKSSKLKYYNGSIPKDYILSPGDIIVTMTDLSKEADTLGFSAKVPCDGVHTYLHNQRIGLVELIDDKVDINFLYWLMRSEPYQKFVVGSATGATVKHTSPSKIYAFKFKAPKDQFEQKKIASILSAYDDLIGINLQQIKLLEEMAHITFEEWFVRMKFPGHEKVKFDSETGLPEGWREGRIIDICYVNKETISRKTAPEYIRYLDIASVNTGSYDPPEVLLFEEAPSRARRKLNFGDTIFSTVRPNRKTYSLILENDPTLIASTGFAVLTPFEQSYFSFIYLTVANQDFVDKSVAVAGGAAYPAINQKDFERLKIIIPLESLIKKFSKITNLHFEAISKLTRQNELLNEARDILLPRLMTGLIKVDEIKLPKSLAITIDKNSKARKIKTSTVA